MASENCRESYASVATVQDSVDDHVVGTVTNLEGICCDLVAIMTREGNVIESSSIQCRIWFTE